MGYPEGGEVLLGGGGGGGEAGLAHDWFGSDKQGVPGGAADPNVLTNPLPPPLCPSSRPPPPSPPHCLYRCPTPAHQPEGGPPNGSPVCVFLLWQRAVGMRSGSRPGKNTKTKKRENGRKLEFRKRWENRLRLYECRRKN